MFGKKPCLAFFDHLKFEMSDMVEAVLKLYLEVFSLLFMFQTFASLTSALILRPV